jgi:hemerythrin-like domain-containing protein
MMPVGPLMIEHRLIERMIGLFKDASQRIKQKHEADTVFIDRAVDFIRTYADRCHHGKEEDILFRGLLKKQLSAEHKRILDELVKEHASARRMTKGLLDSKEAYAQGRKDALSDITRYMEELVVFYPRHIEKEDKHFFLPSMDYFGKKEQADMLREFWEFDKNLIHEKYRTIIEEAEARK